MKRADSEIDNEKETNMNNEIVEANVGAAPTYRVHRVGSITTGIAMVVFGILCIMQHFVNVLDYSVILSLWPLIVIGMGVEILLSGSSNRQFVYDKASVFLLFVMAGFAMCMAIAEWSVRHWGPW